MKMTTLQKNIGTIRWTLGSLKKVFTKSESFHQNKRNFASTGVLNMRFVQFVQKNGSPQQLGVQLKPRGDIVKLSAISTSIPNNLVQFLQGGEVLLQKARRILAEGSDVVAEKDVTLLPPVTNMDKVLCIGLNYMGHCKEQNKEPPKTPMVFNKFPGTLIGPYQDIVIPPITTKADWEAELVIVIGKKCKNIKSADASKYIFGYTIAQDISARDWQKGTRNGGQFLLGKAMDTFCPLGPAVVTSESMPNVLNLQVKSIVNGKVKQDGNTSELIFKPDFLLEYITQFMTLLPGDIILTGTPAGVGFSRNPPEYLKKGDVLETVIDNLGCLKNNIN